MAIGHAQTTINGDISQRAAIVERRGQIRVTALGAMCRVGVRVVKRHKQMQTAIGRVGTQAAYGLEEAGFGRRGGGESGEATETTALGE